MFFFEDSRTRTTYYFILCLYPNISWKQEEEKAATTSEMLTVCIARKIHVDIDFCQFKIKNPFTNWLAMLISILSWIGSIKSQTKDWRSNRKNNTHKIMITSSHRHHCQYHRRPDMPASFGECSAVFIAIIYASKGPMRWNKDLKNSVATGSARKGVLHRSGCFKVRKIGKSDCSTIELCRHPGISCSMYKTQEFKPWIKYI